MLDGHGDEGRKGAADDLLQQGAVVDARGPQAVGADLGDLPLVVIGFAAAVDEVGDEGVEDEDDDGAAGAEDLEVDALGAPALADVLEGNQQEYAGEADGEGQGLDLVEVAEDVADDGGGAGAGVEADEAVDLAEQDDEGDGGDPAGEDGGRDKVEQETELEQADDEGVDADHEGDGGGDGLRGVAFLGEVGDDFGGEEAEDGGWAGGQLWMSSVNMLIMRYRNHG